MEKNEFICQLVKHEEAYELSYRLAQQFLKRGYKPDLVVAIARGGFPPARYLCDFLDLGELAGIRVRHYAAGGQEHESTELKNPLNVQVKTRNILISFR
ncbi:MAG: phosphoribosyltransferase family protein [Desulforhopalus sp.]